MWQIYERLYISSDRGCSSGEGDWAVIHACRAPCYAEAMDTFNHAGEETPHAILDGQDLYLNILDPVEPRFEAEVFHKSLDFMQGQWDEGRTILAQCNAGPSRSPSIALLFLAKRVGVIRGRSYPAAMAGYEVLDPIYSPGSGIQEHLSERWSEFRS